MRNPALKTALLDRIQPLVDKLATDLVALATKRIEAELERIGEAFEVALSSYASNGAPDLIAAALGPELAGMMNTGKPELEVYEPEPGKLHVREVKRQRIASAAPKPRSEAERPRVVRSADTPRGQSTDKPAAPPLPIAGHRPCGCAQRGPHRIGCAMRGAPQPAAITKPVTKPDRRATIAALARKPATRPVEPEVPNASERWSSERIDRERDEAEAHKLEGTLPPAVASFERERPGGMFVELEPEHELDFGAAG